MLKGKKVLLAVTASIAAYKTAELVRLFKKAGASVRVIQTEASLHFVAPLTLSTLSRISFSPIFECFEKNLLTHISLVLE